jgi:ribosomal protein S18 acetylase RimI-like enzyme
MSATIFEDIVLSKPYFDPQGLFIAEHQRELVAMALVGFAPNESQSDLDFRSAIISRLMVDPRISFDEVADRLLKKCYEYANSKSTEKIWYGSQFPHSPFLDGAYGGNLVPGVLESEPLLADVLRRHDFVQTDVVEAFHLALSKFRKVVSRQQITVRRNFEIEVSADPNPSSWYNACCFGKQNCVDFLLAERQENLTRGNLRFWEVQPLSAAWGRRTAGMYFLEIDNEARRSGLATLLMSEAFRQLQDIGFGHVEVQALGSDRPTIALFEKLGFENIDRGFQFIKSL